MIIDRLENSLRYETISPRIQAALRFLRETDFSSVAPGRYELDGAVLYYMLQEYTPKPVDSGVAEAHRNYIDIQYVLQGEEAIGYADLGQVQPGEYLAEKDFLQAQGRLDLVRVPAGSFMVLFPNDVHMPGLATGSADLVRKVVVKVKVE